MLTTKCSQRLFVYAHYMRLRLVTAPAGAWQGSSEALRMPSVQLSMSLVSVTACKDGVLEWDRSYSPSASWNQGGIGVLLPLQCVKRQRALLAPRPGPFPVSFFIDI